MAAAVVERDWRDSTPENVEDDLAALWREIAGRGPAITRAVMANLVVFRFHERRSRPVAESPHGSAESIEALLGLHPSRTIVIEHDRGEHGAQAPSSASVGISIFGTGSVRYGVERIVVRSACADISLPSVVRRFIRGDRPTSVWWTEDLSREAPSDPLIDLARQLIYDSREWRDVRAGFRAVAPLGRSEQIDLADINWRRLTPLRRTLAHAVDGLRANVPLRLSIAHHPDEAALAWLLAGWIAARLHLAPADWPSLKESNENALKGALLTLTIDDGATAVTTTMTSERIEVRREGRATIVVPTPREAPAEAMAAELRMLSRDVALASAIGAIDARLT